MAKIGLPPIYQRPKAPEPHPQHRIWQYPLRWRISIDVRGRWMDNVFIERLWRSLKLEFVFLNAFETGRGLCYPDNQGEIGG